MNIKEIYTLIEKWQEIYTDMDKRTRQAKETRETAEKLFILTGRK